MKNSVYIVLLFIFYFIYCIKNKSADTIQTSNKYSIKLFKYTLLGEER